MIFIMDFSAGHGHTGIVAEVQGGALTTIDGNANDGGSRKGSESSGAPVVRSQASTGASSTMPAPESLGGEHRARSQRCRRPSGPHDGDVGTRPTTRVLMG